MTDLEKLEIGEVVRSVLKDNLKPVEFVEDSLANEVRNKVLAHFKWLAGLLAIPAISLTWIGVTSVKDIQNLNNDLRVKNESLEKKLLEIETKAMHVDNELDRFQKESQDAYGNLNKLLVAETKRAADEAKFQEDSRKRRQTIRGGN